MADRLREEIGVDNLLVGERPFFVRVADKDNNTVFFSMYQYSRISCNKFFNSSSNNWCCRIK